MFPIQCGDVIIWLEREQTLMISDKMGGAKRWSGGDNKALALFIHSDDDFHHFCNILAQTHGLRIEKAKNYIYTAFVFV
jgi:hypothetical protein